MLKNFKSTLKNFTMVAMAFSGVAFMSSCEKNEIILNPNGTTTGMGGGTNGGTTGGNNGTAAPDTVKFNFVKLGIEGNNDTTGTVNKVAFIGSDGKVIGFMDSTYLGQHPDQKAFVDTTKILQLKKIGSFNIQTFNGRYGASSALLFVQDNSASFVAADKGNASSTVRKFQNVGDTQILLTNMPGITKENAQEKAQKAVQGTTKGPFYQMN